jgi:hypothetical protein
VTISTELGNRDNRDKWEKVDDEFPVQLTRTGRLLPFLGAWAIWLTGYGLLLTADFVVRRMTLGSQGLDELPVVVSATLIAGTACGFFLAAAGRWAWPHRFLLLFLQLPFAYLMAVGVGTLYLCAVGVECI